MEQNDLIARAFAFDVASGDTLPTEFRIFTAGVNESSKGRTLFDDEAAAAVMAAYQKHGADLMIDLEHDAAGPAMRSDSHDARGWFRLEMRNGELWAVDVRWTPDGARRLTEKTQRYISPLFLQSKKTGRVVDLLNVALCAAPAMHDAPALVAASRIPASVAPVATYTRGATIEKRTMDPKLIQQALDALIAKDSAKCEEILKSAIASAAGAGDAGGAPSAEAMAETPPPAASPEKPEDKENAVAASKLCKLTACASVKDALDTVESWSARIAKLASDEAALETNVRLGLIADLVKLGAETPATAWSNAETRTPCKRLADEPIADMKSRVVALRSAKGVHTQTATAPQPPASGTNERRALTRHEQAECKRLGLTTEEFWTRYDEAVRRTK